VAARFPTVRAPRRDFDDTRGAVMVQQIARPADRDACAAPP